VAISRPLEWAEGSPRAADQEGLGIRRLAELLDRLRSESLMHDTRAAMRDALLETSISST
jgi:hypothetical protein